MKTLTDCAQKKRITFLANGLDKMIKSDKCSYGRIDHCVSYLHAKFQIIQSINLIRLALDFCLICPLTTGLDSTSTFHFSARSNRVS